MSFVITKHDTDFVFQTTYENKFTGFLELTSTFFLKSLSGNYKVVATCSFSDSHYRDIYEKTKDYNIDLSGIKRNLRLFELKFEIQKFTNNGWEKLLDDVNMFSGFIHKLSSELEVYENYSEYIGFKDALYKFTSKDLKRIVPVILKKHTKISRPVRF